EERPTLVLVDDLHWLDQPSAEAILFAARRLWREGVGVLVTLRPDELDPARLAGLELLEVTALSADDCSELARVLGPAQADRDGRGGLPGATGGNPLAVIETLRSLTSPGVRASVMTPLPVAERIRAGLSRRVGALTDDELQALVTVAAAGTAAPRALV